MGVKHLFVVLLALIEFHCYTGINGDLRRGHETNAEPNLDTESAMHNTTMDCGDFFALRQTVMTCQGDLRQLTVNRDVWFGRGIQTTSENDQNATYDTEYLRDSLDSLNYTCDILDRNRKCLQVSGVRDYCHITASSWIVDIQFICRHQQHNENLIRSLQCLRDKRILAMLYFHIGNHCFRGMDTLDDLMTRMKRQYFYTLNINRPAEMTHTNTRLYCLPRHVISTCVSKIVEDHCGKWSSELVQKYLFYIQDRFNQLLKSAGLSANICEYNNIRSKFPPTTPPVASSEHTNLTFTGWLQMTAPGTALDTVFGRAFMTSLQKRSEKEVCSNVSNAYVAYAACVMSSDDKNERSNFNILQFSLGSNLQSIYHGTQCLRLEQFTACWHLLREICGSAVRGFAQHATLVVESCKIQSEMDTAGCHWQDILLEHYINASRVTVWPLSIQGLHNPLFLDPPHTTTRVMHDLDMLITLLQPGVEEISRKCGQQPDKRLHAVLQQIRYLQYDALKVTHVLSDMVQRT